MSGSCGDALSWDNRTCQGCRTFLDRLVEVVRKSASDGEQSWPQELRDGDWHHDVAQSLHCAALDCHVCEFVSQSLFVKYLPEHETGLYRLHCFLVSRKYTLGVNAAPELVYELNAELKSLPRTLLRPVELPVCTVIVRRTLSQSFVGSAHREVVLTDGPPEASNLIITPVTSTTTSSAETHTKIQRWLQDCAQQHEFCQDWSSLIGATPDLPTRLLELNPENDHPKVRLIATSGMDPTLRYASLSHCWGRTLPVRLTTDTLGMFARDVPWEILPKTFQEAITTTLHLDMRYIWIDALCIVQDDTLDWVKEAALMVNVYANAVINISTDDASNPNEGVYRDRDIKAVRAFDILTTDDEPDSERSWICFNNISDELILASTAGRAWIVQERFLARRVVHFAANQVYWECACRIGSESLSHDIGQADKSSERLLKVQSAMVRELLATRDDKEPVYQLWTAYSTQYSRASLTYDSDRIIAIAGIARAFCYLLNRPPSEYLCGLWQSTIINDLQWVELTPMPGRGSQGVVTPSWSWLTASRGHSYIEADRDWARYHFDTVASLLRVSTAHPGSDPFIALQGTSLIVQAPLCRVRLLYSPRFPDGNSLEPRHIAVDDRSYEEKCRWSSLFLDGVWHQDVDLVEGSPVHEIEVYLMLLEIMYLRDPYVAWNKKNSVTASPDAKEQSTIATLRSKRHAEVPAGSYRCLLLQPAHEPGSYIRVGFMTLAVEEPNVDDIRKSELQLALDRQFLSSDVPEHDYEAVDDDTVAASRYKLTCMDGTRVIRLV